ncbi:ECF transporter S component [Flavonifractor sp. An100]|uniref:ECF transporter S component n=1 Tax=Flavonifractor sp. An100 TaxID=1965538 RepID=UPI000B3A5C48|nr:ECF transporter S component [Flavonifractor sp. An100]OUQ80689.1 ECF transporter S component [Flavonifractor sp. An100]
MQRQNHQIKNLVTAALMLALAYVLPNFTGNIPQIGSMLLPMHLPTILCGFLAGGPWGAAVGFIAPLLRSVLTGGYPPMFPTAIAMAFEMATYGFISGVLSHRLPLTLKGIYISLLSAMVCGRVVWGVVMAIITLGGDSFTFAAFIAGAFTNAIPGIILQLIAVPVLVLTLQKAKLVPQSV